MPARRILCLAFPRLAVDRVLRVEPGLIGLPLVVVRSVAQAQSVVAASEAAAALGLGSGMGLADARAICPDLISRPANPPREVLFLAALRRWSGRFSPWVSEIGVPEIGGAVIGGAESGKPVPGSAGSGDVPGLFLDITGCAHLFGGEAGMAEEVLAGITAMGVATRIGLADTPGAAWAVARYGGSQPGQERSGDAIEQEARATRSRAAKRRWTRSTAPVEASAPRILPPGQTRRQLAALPVTALRLEGGAVAALNRLGVRTIGELAALPRGSVARRFGMEVTQRLDQALGAEPEPISPLAEAPVFSCRLSFPDPIGLEADVAEGMARLLDGLCARLELAGRAARRLRLVLCRADGTWQALEIGLARPSQDPAVIRPLLALKLKEADAGFGIDVMRLIAHVHEPVTLRQHTGHFEAAAAAKAKMRAGGGAEFEALMSRLGARVGLEAMTRYVPAASHLPEKAATVAAAAFAEAVEDWPSPPAPRPLVMFRPEPVQVVAPGRPPEAFRWRRRDFVLAGARGPERIAPEWWLDDPDWRSGPRDYWVVEAKSGERLWMFEALGGEINGGWFMGGDFV